jgi:hypothetical protein
LSRPEFSLGFSYTGRTDKKAKPWLKHFLPSGWCIPEAFLWRALSGFDFQEGSATEYQK